MYGDPARVNNHVNNHVAGKHRPPRLHENTQQPPSPCNAAHHRTLSTPRSCSWCSGGIVCCQSDTTSATRRWQHTTRAHRQRMTSSTARASAADMASLGSRAWRGNMGWCWKHGWCWETHVMYVETCHQPSSAGSPSGILRKMIARKACDRVVPLGLDVTHVRIVMPPCTSCIMEASCQTGG